MAHLHRSKSTPSILNTRLLATVLLFVCSVGQSTYAVPFFRDDFDRAAGGTLHDFADAEWFVDDTPEELLTIENGALTITPLTSDFPGASVTGLGGNPADVRLQTRVRIVDANSNSVRPFVFLLGRGQGGDASYTAGYGPNGTIDVSRVLNGQITSLASGGSSYGSLVDVNVNMEMILSGNKISFTMWPDGAPKPSAPQIRVTDSGGDRAGQRRTLHESVQPVGNFGRTCCCRLFFHAACPRADQCVARGRRLCPVTCASASISIV